MPKIKATVYAVSEEHARGRAKVGTLISAAEDISAALGEFKAVLDKYSKNKRALVNRIVVEIEEEEEGGALAL